VTDNGLAALAAALPNVPTVKALTIRLGRFNGAWWDRFASEILDALDGWTLRPADDDIAYEAGAEDGNHRAEAADATIATLRAALDGLVAAAEETVRSAILVEIGPDTEVWSVHSTSLASLRAALAAVKEATG